MSFSSLEAREDLVWMEKRRNKLLDEQEEMWRLKSKEIWLSCVDGNKKFFQAYARGRKHENTIWDMKNVGGETIASF